MKEASHSKFCSNSRKGVQLNREPRALCVKVERFRGSGIIRVNWKCLETGLEYCIGAFLCLISNIRLAVSS